MTTKSNRLTAKQAIAEAKKAFTAEHGKRAFKPVISIHNRHFKNNYVLIVSGEYLTIYNYNG
jgi:hypothetical protein